MGARPPGGRPLAGEGNLAGREAPEANQIPADRHLQVRVHRSPRGPEGTDDPPQLPILAVRQASVRRPDEFRSDRLVEGAPGNLRQEALRRHARDPLIPPQVVADIPVELGMLLEDPPQPAGQRRRGERMRQQILEARGVADPVAPGELPNPRLELRLVDKFPRDRGLHRGRDRL